MARTALQQKLSLTLSQSTLAYIDQSALTYAGHTVWNRSNERITSIEEGRRRCQYVTGKKLSPEHEWVVKRDTHEPLISNEEAEAILKHCQQRRASQTRHRRSVYMLGSILECGCGARMEGNSGFYCCSKSCGMRGIKRETLDQAVLSAVIDKLVNLTMLVELRKQVQKECQNQARNLNSTQAHAENQLREIEKEMRELSSLISKARHQRPILERMDSLEDERLRLEAQQKEYQPQKIERDLSDDALARFIKDFKSNLEQGDVERKKAMIRSVIGKAVLNNGILHLHPAIESITGVKMASPRSFLPYIYNAQLSVGTTTDES